MSRHRGVKYPLGIQIDLREPDLCRRFPAGLTGPLRYYTLGIEVDGGNLEPVEVLAVTALEPPAAAAERGRGGRRQREPGQVSQFLLVEVR